MKSVKLIARSCAALMLVTSVVGTVTLVSSQDANAQGKSKLERKTKRTPALRSKVYDQLARAQSLADQDKTAEAITALDNVKRKSSSMNSYELAMMHNFYGFIHYNVEKYDKAIASFEEVVKQQPIPESFEKSTLYSLSQLHMMQGNFDKTIDFLERWERLNTGEVPAKNLVLKAQAMYQNKDYPAASRYINQAVLQQENSQQGFKVEESWYVLQRAVYYELKQPEKVTEVLVKLVKHFNKPEYWVQLGGMYGELGHEQKQLAVLESAYQQGYITKGADLFSLAQLYYYHQVPFKAATVMESALENGALQSNLTNLTFLSQSWSAAKENEKALPVMIAAAHLSANGDLDAQLGQFYLNMENFDKAIEASQRALDKGELRNQGTTYLVLGMAHFNKGQFVESLNNLAKAEGFNNSKLIAKQWAKYVSGEKINQERLRNELSSMGS